jgi:hypothetical protein
MTRRTENGGLCEKTLPSRVRKEVFLYVIIRLRF